MKSYVIYKRVSTKRQGESGLGLAAQVRDIDLFLQTYSEEPYEILAEFTDVQSGKDDDRPELQKAIEVTKRLKAILLVAKLDRLSRKVSFIAKLIEDEKLTFRVANMPYADTFQLHIYAALAQQERDFISKRTKAALSEAKKRGVKLGGRRPNSQAANDVLKDQADRYAARLIPLIKPMREAGKTYQQIADSLNASGIPTSRGASWKPVSVKRVLERVG